MTTSHPITPKRRGRPRSFDVQGVLDAALEQFWRKGYGATATRDLEVALGISQSSIYNAFGSKGELFDAVLDLYEQRASKALLSPIENESDGLKAVDAFFAALRGWLTRTPRSGCLLTNTLLETSDNVERHSIGPRASRYRQKVHEALHVCLTRAAENDQMAKDSVDDRTDLLVGLALGINVAARGAPPNDELDRLVGAARAEVARWRAARP